MKKHFVFAFFCFIVTFSLFAQTSGPDPREIFTGDNGYNLFTIRNRTLKGDNIGRIQFSGWLSPSEKWYPGAEIKSVVSGLPGPSYMPTDLGFYTGGTTLQERVRILENGNTGINQSSPTARLSVLDFDNPNKTIFEAIGGSTGSGQKKFQISNTANGFLHTFLQGNMEIESGNMVVKDGKVGIGVLPDDMPGDHKLYVNGSAICSKMIVELKVNWPDYVYSNDYKLIPLKELEAYIHKEAHLPGVPSAEEVGKNGLDLGETQRITIEKIEQLTLYIIQQQKEIDTLKERLEKIESKHKRLKR